MSICDKCERESECLVAYGDDFCLNYVRKPQTNADRIRQMTNEELAEFISGKARTFGEEYEGFMSALDWLKQEATP